MSTNGNGNGDRYFHDLHEALSTLFPHIMEVANIPGHAATFVINRPDEDADASRSFSVDAMDVLHTELMVFVVSRIMRAWKNTTPPKQLTVDINVDVV